MIIAVVPRLTIMVMAMSAIIHLAYAAHANTTDVVGTGVNAIDVTHRVHPSTNVGETVSSPPDGCTLTATRCLVAGGIHDVEGVPVYQDCWDQERRYECPNWRRVKNSCDALVNCHAMGLAVPVDAWHQSLTMACEEKSVTRACVAWQSPPQDCRAQAVDYGQGNQQFSTDAVNNLLPAMQSIGLLDALQSSVRSDRDPLQVFGGEVMTCKKPLAPMTVNCCDSQVGTHDDGNLTLNQCDERERELAAATRAGYTHWVGEWCAHRYPWPLDHTCSEQRQGVCRFDSVLARLIQEQGRAQINALALQDQHTIAHEVTFPLWSSTPHWEQLAIGELSLAVYHDQLPDGPPCSSHDHPEHDQSHGKPHTQHTQQPAHCYHEVVSVAVCQRAGQCGALPRSPAQFAQTHWRLFEMGMQVADYRVVDERLAIKGDCQQQRCHWRIKVLPEHYSPTVITVPVSWTLTQAAAASTTITTTTAAAATTVMNARKVNSSDNTLFSSSLSPTLPPAPASIAETASVPIATPLTDNTTPAVIHTPLNVLLRPMASPFRTMSTAAMVNNSDIPAPNHASSFSSFSSKSFRLQYRLPDETQWREYPAAIPFHVDQAAPITLREQPLLQWYGDCQPVSGACRFYLRAAVTLKPMPWGTAAQPQCQGFTPDALLLLDMSRMDLSEWSNASLQGVQLPQQQAHIDRIQQQLPALSDAMQGKASITTTRPSRRDAVVLAVAPLSGQGPFSVTLTATARWPKAIPQGECGYPLLTHSPDMVSSLLLDWGDGSLPERLNSDAVHTITAVGQRADGSGDCRYHVPVFQATHRYPVPPGHTITQEIKAVFNTASGHYTTTVKVMNRWNTATPTPTGGGVVEINTHAVHPNQLPGVGQFNPAEVPGIVRVNTQPTQPLPHHAAHTTHHKEA